MGPSTDARLLSPSEKKYLGLGTRIAGNHELQDLPSLSYMHVGIKERRLLLYRGLMMSCCRNKKGGRVAWYKSIECSNQRSLFAKFSTWKGLVSSWSGVDSVSFFEQSISWSSLVVWNSGNRLDTRLVL